MTIGEKLKNLRVKMKKTLSEQSEIFGVSLNSVYRWEHDLVIPRKAVLKKMADFYGVSLGWLLSENEIEEAAYNDENGHQSEDGIERQLLFMFRKLAENKKYKILGYVERMCVEDIDKIQFREE